MKLWTNAALVAATLLHAQAARSDGLSFDGERPLFPHLVVELDPGQRTLVAVALEQKRMPVELRLTAAQSAAIKQETGATVSWLFAADREVVTQECTCGAYNLGVVVGGRAIVYKLGLGDFLSPGDLRAIEAELVIGGRAPARTPGSGPRPEWRWFSPEEPRPVGIDTLLARLPPGQFERTIRLPAQWRPFRVRLPALPQLGDESDQDYLALFADPERIQRAPREGSQLAWPTAGARLDGADGTVTWLLLAIVPPGIGAPARGWAVFEYRQGRLTAVAVNAEVGLRGWAMSERPAGE